MLLLKTGPTGAQSPVSARAAAIASGDNKWQWEKVKPSSKGGGSSSSSPSSSDLLKGFGGSNGMIMGNGAAAGGAGAGGAGPGGGDSYRWRHTEAVKLLERALAVHREVILMLR